MKLFADRYLEDLIKQYPSLPAEGLAMDLLNLRTKIRKIRDTQGDDKCWKDYESLFSSLPEGYTPPERDETVELELCKHFIRSCHDPNVRYVSPQRRIEELESRIKFWSGVLRNSGILGSIADEMEDLIKR